MLKLSTILLRKERPSEDSKFETSPIASCSTRATSNIKRKLEWTAEETSGTPKRMIDEECSSSSTMKSSAQLRATKRRKACTGLLGFRVNEKVAIKKDD